MTESSDARGIAIIGMACRFPGADQPFAFWTNLCRGVESITFFSDEELLAAGVDPSLLAHPGYVKAAPVLTDVDKFDAAFFGYSPREAAIMDPQQRLFLETAWEAFEDAGYHPESSGGVTGVFAGGGGVVTSYLMAHRGHPAFPGQTAGLSHLGNDKDFLSTRVSYKLNLTGPSVTVQTACSTSLVAVHLACQSLLRGECDMVLAGAATVRIPQVSGYLVEKGNVHSADGHCRAFDAAGQGTIFGSGVAAVLLKDLRRALADGDHVYAVIKGTAVNNDGGAKISYTAPSVSGQARAMLDAVTVAGVPPETIGYVECHATGTAIGDPPEIQALTQVFRTQTSRRRFCAVGSVKTNMGHPEQAAGLAGLIKTALALRHGRIPPSLHFVTPNPKIDFDQSPFYVNTALSDWPTNGHPRRAAVNSLGIGGTNAFAVLEEAPPTPAPEPEPRPLHVFTLSAKTDTALLAYAERFRAFLDAAPSAGLADLCYTANVSRSHFRHRFAATTGSVGDLAAKLAAFAAERTSVASARSKGEKRPVAFLFTGQGSQYPGMAEELYHTQPTFRRVLQECDAGLRSHLDKPLLDVLFGRGPDGALLHETIYTQPALFAVEYALADLWRAWGVVPGAVMGHSIGELVAACVAGVFDLADALRLVADRGRLMQGLPKDGAMAVTFAGEEAVREALDPALGRVAIAAVNGPQNTVISGERSAVAEVLGALQSRNIASKALTVSHAFHSPLMDPILDRLEEAARAVTQRTPELTLISNLTGRPVAGTPTAGHWRDHARRPVRFADGIRTLHELGYRLFLEVGPGSALLGMGRQCQPDAGTAWLSSLSPQKRDWQTMLESLQALYVEGGAINWPRVHEGAPRRRVPLPTYPFQRKRYWLDGAASGETADTKASARVVHPLLGQRTSGPAGTEFEALYGVAQLPYLNDHRVHGLTVLPTAAGLEAALAAGRAHFGGGPVQLEDLTYHQALILPDDAPRPVRLVLKPGGDDRVTFRLLSRDTDGSAEWRTHMSGVLSRAAATASGDAQAATPAFTEATRASCPRETPADRFYAAVKELGLEYGPSFQGIRQLWRGEAAALARVRLPARASPGSYGLHPAFLDACLHVYPAAIDEYWNGNLPSARDGDTYLPVGVERFRVYREQATEGWTHAVVRDQRTRGQTVVVDIRVYEADGTLVATLDGLSLRRLPRATLAVSGGRGLGDWLYQLRWRERRPPAPPRTALASWLVFADRGGVGAALAEVLEERGDWCQLVFADPADPCSGSGRSTVDPARLGDFRRLIRDESVSAGLPCRGVVYLWGLDVPSLADMTADRLELAEALGTRGALFLTQALAESRSAGAFAPRLWLVTRHAQNADPGSGPPVEAAQAPLWGLGRTVALEHPAMWGGLIDLPPALRPTPREDAVALAAELRQADGEREVALRHGKRFVARLVRLPREEAHAPCGRFRDDATYLITGGLGMLGLRVARWLVEEHGVRFLVLVGRRNVEGRAQDAVAVLRGRGATVDLMQADVSVEADVERLLDEIRAHRPPLKGVIHCAGVVDDGVLGQMDWSKFVRATAPKIKGSWFLHRHTRDMGLDVFVLHSSLLSLTGSAGQANYTAANAFVDALAAHRRDLGLPAMVVNWGPWADAGMAAAMGARGTAIWRTRGTRHLPPDDGIRALEHLMGRGIDHATVTITDWATYLEQFSEPPPLYAELAREVGPVQGPKRPAGDGDMQARLREAPAREQRALLLESIRRQVMDELGFEETIDPAQPLDELGLDSLMSVNVANRLERALGIAVPIAKLIRGPSLTELVDDLFPHLASVGGADAASPAITPRTARAAGPAGIPPAAGISTTSGDGWLVRPRPNPAARARLFCFHYAGGSAAVFRPWVDTLDPAIELVAIEPPGRGGRADEPLVETLDAFVERLLPAMTPYLDKPFALFGHCLGALTLFETARRLLARQPQPLEHVFVSGARPPHLLAREGPFEEEMLAHLLRHPEFDPLRPGHEQPDDVFADMLRRFNIGATDEFLKNPELRRLLLPVVRADFAMAFHYRFAPAPPWNAPVTCFVGLGDPYVSRGDALEWGRYTQVAFRLLLRETAHFLIVDDRGFIVDTINRELGRRPTPTQGGRDG